MVLWAVREDGPFSVTGNCGRRKRIAKERIAEKNVQEKAGRKKSGESA